MKVSQTVELENGFVQFQGELNQQETDALLTLGLTVAIAAGQFPGVTEALKQAQKQEEADQGYDFPDNMEAND